MDTVKAEFKKKIYKREVKGSSQFGAGCYYEFLEPCFETSKDVASTTLFTSYTLPNSSYKKSDFIGNDKKALSQSIQVI